MRYAEKKFASIVQHQWSHPSFPEVIKLAYEVAPPDTRGDGIRAIVVKTAALHVERLYGRNDHFATVMSSVADFWKDLSLALSGIYKFSADPTLHSLLGMTTWECESCKLIWSDTRVLNDTPSCPRCDHESAIGRVATRQLHTYACSDHDCDYYLESATSTSGRKPLVCPDRRQGALKLRRATKKHAVKKSRLLGNVLDLESELVYTLQTIEGSSELKQKQLSNVGGSGIFD